MRRLISAALTLVLATCTSAEPALALGSEHACCFARLATAAATKQATEEKVACHDHSGTRPPSISEAHSAHSEHPNGCCYMGTASRAAQPEPSPSSAGALHFVASVTLLQFQPRSQAEPPAPSGRAPPSRSSC